MKKINITQVKNIHSKWNFRIYLNNMYVNKLLVQNKSIYITYSKLRMESYISLYNPYLLSCYLSL